MIDERYDVKTAPNVESFEFDSIGPKGTIHKVVRYSEINIHNFYNLGFGDKDDLTGFIKGHIQFSTYINITALTSSNKKRHYIWQERSGLLLRKVL